MTCSRYTESDLGRIKAVTSATRPTGASRYVSQRIYETDTGRELLYDGTNWVIMSEPVQSYTPTLSNITLGNGTLTGRYHRSDGYCDWEVLLTLGSTSAVTGAAGISLPVAASSVGNAMVGNVMFYDASVGMFLGYLYVNSTTVFNPSYISSLTGAGTFMNTTTPFTWTTSDTVYAKGRYRMTTRYS